MHAHPRRQKGIAKDALAKAGQAAARGPLRSSARNPSQDRFATYWYCLAVAPFVRHEPGAIGVARERQYTGLPCASSQERRHARKSTLRLRSLSACRALVASIALRAASPATSYRAIAPGAHPRSVLSNVGRSTQWPLRRRGLCQCFNGHLAPAANRWVVTPPWADRCLRFASARGSAPRPPRRGPAIPSPATRTR